jgi:MYXO-CTERM domain-containing protein
MLRGRCYRPAVSSRQLIAPLAIACFAALVARDAPARADIVMPATAACPTGSYAQPSHNGPYCALASCWDDRGCETFFNLDRVEAPAKLAKEPMVCAYHPLCIRTDMVSAGRFHPVRKVERQSVVGTCSPSGGCPEGSRCAPQNACVPRRIAGDAGTPPPPRPADAGPPPANDAAAAPVDIPVPAPPAATGSAAGGDAAPAPTDVAPGEPSAPGAPVPPPAASSCGSCAAGEAGHASTAAVTFGLVVVVALRRRRRAR